MNGRVEGEGVEGKGGKIGGKWEDGRQVGDAMGEGAMVDRQVVGK